MKIIFTIVPMLFGFYCAIVRTNIENYLQIDKTYHILFFQFATFLMLWWRFSLFQAFACGMALGVGIEIAQALFTTRGFSVGDLVANFLGISSVLLVKYIL